ncbi:GNAT family N-acetyltransferase [Nitrosopumilus sp. S4]
MSDKIIREGTSLDKNSVLDFCKNTFSWGDYIDQVWDYWLKEGNLFVFEKNSVSGICHASYSDNQVWIEGIRIEPNSRREKIASQLVQYAEHLGEEKNISFSYMLIETKNNPSLLMAKSLNYSIFESWNFYTLIPKKNITDKIQFAKNLKLTFSHYVKSWRWLPMDNSKLRSFLTQNKIIKSNEPENFSFAILSESEHFAKTLIVTLFSNSKKSTLEIFKFLQNFAIEKDYQRIQILSKEDLPAFNTLEKKISFYLMKKTLR